MSDSEQSPLLATRDVDHQSQPESGNESTPLLSGGDAPRYDGDESQGQHGDDSASIRSRHSNTSSKSASKQRWPSIIAMIILAILSITIMIVAFFAPAAVEEYAKQAAVLEPTSLSLESITTDGVRARIKANFRLDGSKVENDQVRRVGSVATWFVRELGTEATRVNVYLPEYNNILLGSTDIPPITLKIDGQNTAIDFVAELVPGAAEGIRMIANEWLEGRLNQLRITGKADIKLKTGIIPLGTHMVSESLTLEASKLPGGGDGDLPPYNITRLFFRDIDNHTVGAEVSISMYNKWPVELNIPPLAFEVLLANCGLHDPYIQVADALTETVVIKPHSNVVANVHGAVGKLPDSLTRLCPDSGSTPLDRLLKQYLGGESPPVYVRGKRHPTGGTPEWLNEIMSQVVVPVPFPERSFDNLIRNFSLTETHFGLPDPMAEPGDPDANPKVSGTIQAIANLPQEMNFGINVTHIRASADVLYKNQKLGVLDLRKWQAANSTKVESSNGNGLDLMIRSRIIDAPLNVTDADVFTDVIQQLIFKGKTIHLEIKALVDVEIETVLGELVLKDIPAEGMIPVKPILNGGSSKHNLLARLKPEVGFIKILETTPSSIRLEALVNITNPTPYTATIPYISAHILCNGSTIGEVMAENMDIMTGNNSYLVVQAKWEPSAGGIKAKAIGREFLSQYLSGFNTTLSVRAHRDSIPGQPLLGEALSHFNLTIPAPHLSLPGDNDDDADEPGSEPPARKGHFIRDAIFHLFSSSAQFTLASPLQYNTVYLEHINATAFYNHTEPIGQITYDLPIAATPGLSQTPRLPVDWSMGSIGREKLRKALGGGLKLDAIATVGVRIGEWREKVWYVGKGIGASVRL